MSWWTRHGQAILAILGGVVTSIFVNPLALNVLVILGWRRPIQEWMIAHGAGRLVWHLGLLYINIPDFTTAIIGGGVIGVVAWKRWWQLSLVYSGVVFALPYLTMTLDGSISRFLNLNAWSLVTVLFLDSAVIPLTLGGGCFASKSRRRRDVRRELGLCLKCGYDLTGNESGTCSECGRPIEQLGC